MTKERQKTEADGLTPLQRYMQRREFNLYMKTVTLDPQWYERPAPGFSGYAGVSKKLKPNETLWRSWFEEERKRAQPVKHVAAFWPDQHLGPARSAVPSDARIRPLRRVPARKVSPEDLAHLKKEDLSIPKKFLPAYLKLSESDRGLFKKMLIEGRRQIATVRNALLVPEKRNAFVESVPFELAFDIEGTTVPPFLKTLEAILMAELAELTLAHNNRVQRQEQEHTSLQ